MRVTINYFRQLEIISKPMVNLSILSVWQIICVVIFSKEKKKSAFSYSLNDNVYIGLKQKDNYTRQFIFSTS